MTLEELIHHAKQAGIDEETLRDLARRSLENRRREGYTAKCEDIREWLGVRAIMDAASCWYWNPRKRRAASVLRDELMLPGFPDPYALVERVHAIYRGDS